MPYRYALRETHASKHPKRAKKNCPTSFVLLVSSFFLFVFLLFLFPLFAWSSFLSVCARLFIWAASFSFPFFFFVQFFLFLCARLFGQFFFPFAMSKREANIMKSAGAAVVTEGSTPERRPSGELAHGASSSINTVSVVMADVAAMHGRIQELEYENIRLKASQTYADQLAEVERQRAKLWEQVNELRLRNENLETENSTLRDKVTSLQEANADLQDRLTTLEAKFEALKHAVEDDQSAIALMQLTTCFQSKAARFLLPPKFAGLKASGKSKAALAQYWKVGRLRDTASQIDGARKTELTQQLSMRPSFRTTTSTRF